MTTRAPEVDLKRFLQWLSTQGEVSPGLTATALIGLMRKDPSILTEAMETAHKIEPIVAPPDDDYTGWTPNRRVLYNTNALRALRALRISGRTTPNPTEVAALSGWTGFGGLKPTSLPIDDVTLWPPIYQQALVKFRQAREQGGEKLVKALMDPALDVLNGVLQQYYTPLNVCRAMWGLIEKITPHQYTLHSALEPSAGVGRFLRAAPEVFEWTLVDVDPINSEILPRLYPTASIHAGAFESFARQVTDKYDVIIGNPPYGSRPAQYPNIDPGFKKWESADNYFTARCSTMLNPGGILAMLTPLNQVAGTKAESTALRRYLTQRCHFMGAAIPPASIFPEVMEGKFVLQFWLARAEPISEDKFSVFDNLVIAGDYFKSPLGKQSILGHWVDGLRGQYLEGTFDETACVAVPMATLTRETIQAIQAARELLARQANQEDDDVPVVVPVQGKPLTQREVADTAYAERARLLEARLTDYFAKVATGSAQAEALRVELLADVQDFVQIHGNPHTLSAIRQHSRDFRSLLVTVSPTGLYSNQLTQMVALGALPIDGLSFSEVVAFYALRHGYATVDQLSRHFQGPMDALFEVSSPDTMMEWVGLEEMTPVYMPSEDYLTGMLYPRLQRLERNMPLAATEAVRERLEEQKRLLLTRLAPRSLAELGITPRSPLVPLDVLQQWFTDDWTKLEGASPNRPFKFSLVNTRLHFEPLWSINREGGARAVTKDDLPEKQYDRLVHFIGYYNEENTIHDPLGISLSKPRVYPSTAQTPEERADYNQTLIDSFLTWLGNHEDVAQTIENKFNETFNGYVVREWPTAPFPIGRLTPHHRPHAHQWSETRRLYGQGGGICAGGVGYGKTLVGLMTVAHWRQSGRARRPIVTVPNSLVFKWLKDAAQWLPDYHVCLMGYSPRKHADTDGTVGWTKDNEATRVAKWRAFAAGEYDLLIVSKDLFLRDTELSPEALLEVFVNEPMILAAAGADEEDRRHHEFRIRELEPLLAHLKHQRALPQDDREYVGQRPPKQPDDEDLDKRIAETQKSINVSKAKVNGPGESALIRLREQLKTKAYSGVYRPTTTLKVWDADSTLDVLQQVARDHGVPHPANATQEDLVARLAKMGVPTEQKGTPIPGLVEWTSLGCDLLIADEAHSWKNLYTLPSGINGVQVELLNAKEDSKAAWDGYVKARTLQMKNQGIVLLTATPVVNSPVELYSMVSIVNQKLWVSRGITSPHEFAVRYLEIRLEMNTKIDGGQIIKGTLAGTLRREELLQVLNTVMKRTLVTDLVKAGVLKNVPEGTPVHENVVMDATQEAMYEVAKKAFAEILGEPDLTWCLEGRLPGDRKKAADVEELDLKEKGRLMLIWMGLIQKIALDPVLLEEDMKAAEAYLESVKKLARAYNEWVAAGRPPPGKKAQGKGANYKGPTDAKIIESLLATATAHYKAAKSLEELLENYHTLPPKYVAMAKNVARAPGCGHVIFFDFKAAIPRVKRALTDYAGIDSSRIAVITGDATTPDQRQKIAQKFNSGEYDVVLGTTATMGEGLDLQERTCALHHVNLTWTPAALEQRNGRAVRQGNENSRVDLFYYISKGSTDGFFLSKVLGKKGWLDSLFEPVLNDDGTEANPLVPVRMSREELMIELFVKDPGEADCQRVTLRALRLAEQQAREVARAAKDFRNLMGRYKAARRVKDPTVRGIQMSLIDSEASKLYDNEYFARKDLLPAIRETEVWYDAEYPERSLIQGIPYEWSNPGENRTVKFKLLLTSTINRYESSGKLIGSMGSFVCRVLGELKDIHTSSLVLWTTPPGKSWRLDPGQTKITPLSAEEAVETFTPQRLWSREDGSYTYTVFNMSWSSTMDKDFAASGVYDQMTESFYGASHYVPLYGILLGNADNTKFIWLKLANMRETKISEAHWNSIVVPYLETHLGELGHIVFPWDLNWTAFQDALTPNNVTYATFESGWNGSMFRPALTLPFRKDEALATLARVWYGRRELPKNLQNYYGHAHQAEQRALEAKARREARKAAGEHTGTGVGTDDELPEPESDE
jgi:hypothetical protein